VSGDSSYRFLVDIATADVAFEAWGKDVASVCGAAVTAMLDTMMEDPAALGVSVEREVVIEEESEEMLVHGLLEELLYHKDAFAMLYRAEEIDVGRVGDTFRLRAVLRGERIDPARHRIGVDVKAVTMHRLSVRHERGGVRATVVLDV